MNPDLHATEQLHDQIATPPVVESFSQSQINIIQKEISNLQEDQLHAIEKEIKKIEKNATPWDKEHISTIIKILVFMIDPSEQKLLPTLIKNLRKNHKDISTREIDIPWYINIVLWRAKTQVNIESTLWQNVQAPSWSDAISDEEKKLDEQLAQKNEENNALDTNINKWKDQIDTLDDTINNKKQVVDAKQVETKQIVEVKETVETTTDQTQEKLIKSQQKLRDIYDSNKDNIQGSLWTIDKSIVINRIPTKELQAFRKAFWYKEIQPEKPGGKPDYEAWINR